MSSRAVFFFFFSFLTALVAAAGTEIVNPTTAAASATAIPSAHGYKYVGCWNETANLPQADGARALDGGQSSANNTMTVDDCLKYCSSGSNGEPNQYAGLEYGRECYCSATLNYLSEKLNDTKCKYACNGNSSEICGGALALTLYNLTADSKEGIAWSMMSTQPAWYGTAAIAMLVLAAVL